MLSPATFIHAVAALFTEAYEGPQDGSSYWFTDNQAGALLPTLSSLSAEEASTSLDGSGMPGSTIAAHAEHLRWSLALSNALARGEHPNVDWEESWSVRTVDTEEWNRLRDALREEYQRLLEAIQTRTDLPAELVTPGIAIVAHGAYHLGAIRQMVGLLRRA
ncbi:MAG TPA: hypothetical protein VFB38_17435 [Chthonomonadaceae bacterium]|nr:hypothetical protein [Chthonomonadaceae bacterium]